MVVFISLIILMTNKSDSVVKYKWNCIHTTCVHPACEL